MFRKSRWRRPTHCLVSCPACFNAFASAVDPNLWTLIQRRDIYAQKNLISRSIWVICIIWKIMWRWQKCCIRINGHISQERVYFFEWNHYLYFKLVGIFVIQIMIWSPIYTFVKLLYMNVCVIKIFLNLPDIKLSNRITLISWLRFIDAPKQCSSFQDVTTMNKNCCTPSLLLIP